MAHPVIDRPHTVSSYDLQLAEVRAIINRLAEQAQAMLSGGLDALLRGDALAASEIVAADKAIDALERSLERLALHIIMSRAPMAQDLRYLIGAIRIGKMLERTGDQGKRMARRIDQFDLRSLGPRFAVLRQMERFAAAMLADAIDAFNRGSGTAARKVIDADAQLNAMHQSMMLSCREAMDRGELSSADGIQLVLLAKQLERVGDYATNIAGDVAYMLDGA